MNTMRGDAYGLARFTVLIQRGISSTRGPSLPSETSVPAPVHWQRRRYGRSDGESVFQRRR